MSKDALGWKCKFAVVAPSTNTIVQPDMDDLRLKGITNHYGRIHIPNMKVGNDKQLVETKQTYTSHPTKQTFPNHLESST